MGAKNAPSYCKGSGLVFAERKELSQISWMFSRSSPTTAGNVTHDDLNEGNSILLLKPRERVTLERIHDYDIGLPPSRVSDIIKGADSEYHRGVEQYDNVAFLILSVAAILSSTAVASVSPGREIDRIMIVLVEASVVYSFLAIVTHAMIVLLRREAYSLDITLDNRLNLTFGDGENIILARLNYSMTTVGIRTTFPIKLVITEIVSVLSALIVTWTIVVAFVSIKCKKNPNVLSFPDADSEGVEKVVVGLDDLSESGGGREKISLTRRIRNMVSPSRDKSDTSN